MSSKHLILFGGDLPWSPLDWTSSDDRVRGGQSQSYMTVTPTEPIAHFQGTLDIKTLGGAGFASQRTTGEDRAWDLHHFDGVALELKTSSKDVNEKRPKTYTFILKDTLLPPDPSTGREQSTISYEHDFEIPSPSEAQQTTTTLRIPFSALKPTYRGKPKPDARSLNTYRVARLSVMCRSFFGTQEGEFDLGIRSIGVYREKKGAMEKFAESGIAMPVVLSLGTATLMTCFVWGLNFMNGR